MVIYIMKNEGLERLTDNMRFVPNLNINAENLHFFFNVSGTLHAHAKSFLRAQVEGFLGLIFPKYLFAH